MTKPGVEAPGFDVYEIKVTNSEKRPLIHRLFAHNGVMTD